MSILTSEITTDYLMQVTQELLPAVGTLCHMYIRVMHIDKVSQVHIFSQMFIKTKSSAQLYILLKG